MAEKQSKPAADGGSGGARKSRRKRASENGADDATAALDALRDGLAEALPGFEVLDRDLAYDDERSIELVGVDASGRLSLVLIVDEDVDRATLDALDALAFARRDAELVARHLGDSSLDVGLDPRVLLVVDGASDALVERMLPLLGREVDVFAIRSLKSAAGQRTYLAAVGPRELTRGDDAGSSPETFVVSLPDDLQEVARTLVRRMARLDDELATRAGPRTLAWSLDGDVLARAERIGDRLRASVAPAFEPLGLEADGDVERVVEAALDRLVAVLGAGPEREGPPRDAAAPRDDGPLLSAEEIEAFRE